MKLLAHRHYNINLYGTIDKHVRYTNITLSINSMNKILFRLEITMKDYWRT